MGALKKIPWEERRRQDYAEDHIQDLIITDEVLHDFDVESTVAPGYIQHLGVRPLEIILFTDKQIQLFIGKYRNGTCWLYVDATGSIIHPTRSEQKRLLYYTAVIKNPVTGQPPLPVCEMITESHTTASITNFFLRFKTATAQFQRNPRPQKVEVDFSWALIQGVLLSFNQHDIKAYLDYCFKVHVLAEGKLEKNHFTIIHLCCAHFMKQMSNYIFSHTKDRSLAKFALMVFGRLQVSRSLSQALQLYRSISTVFLSPQTTADMKLHLGNLKKSIITSDSNHFQGGTSLSSAENGASENSHLHTMSIKLASPFSAEFNAIQREVEQSIKVLSIHKEHEENEYFSQGVFECFANYIHLFPLWSGVMLHLTPESITRDSNASVECWMRLLKQDILQKQQRMKAARFVRIMYGSLPGRIRAYHMLFAAQKRKKADLNQDTDLGEEEWMKTRKSNKKRTYFDRPTSIPSPKKKHKESAKESPRQEREETPRGLTNLGNTC